MALSFLCPAFVRILQLLRLFQRDSEELAIEVVRLRHEVAVLRRQVARPALRPSDRALLAGLSPLLGRRHLDRFFIQPETLLRWHRDLMGRSWTCPHDSRRPGGSRRHRRDRPPVGEGDPTWGYRRIHGELDTMGLRLAPSSVWTVLRRHGIDPSPRRTGPTWTEFSEARRRGCWPATSSPSTRSCFGVYVLFFIEVDTRRRWFGRSQRLHPGRARDDSVIVEVVEATHQTVGILWLDAPGHNRWLAFSRAMPSMPGVSVCLSAFQSSPSVPLVSRQRPVRVWSLQTGEVSDLWRLSQRFGGGERQLEGRSYEAQGGLRHGACAGTSSCHEWSVCLRAHSRGRGSARKVLARW